MRYILPLLFLVVLSGCANPTLISKKAVVIDEPKELENNCKKVTDYPDPSTLTDLEVAKLIVELERNNDRCVATNEAQQRLRAGTKAIVN